MGTRKINSLAELSAALRTFSAEREWDRFHSPKNLASALIVEAAELLEHFQWLTEEQCREPSTEKIIAIGEEMADVLIYLARLADKLDIDLLDVTEKKMERNAEKYPAEKARGNSRKYTDL